MRFCQRATHSSEIFALLPVFGSNQGRKNHSIGRRFQKSKQSHTRRPGHQAPDFVPRYFDRAANSRHLVAMVEITNTGVFPAMTSADDGYSSRDDTMSLQARMLPTVIGVACLGAFP
jgi:hypothetical protein